MDNGNENGSILAPESRTGGKDGSEVVRPSKGSENAPEALKTEITIFATSSEIMIDLMGDVSTAIPFAMMGKCDRRGTLRLLERIEAFLRDGVKDGSALIGPLTHAAMQAKLDRVGIELAEAADLLQAAILREAAQAEVIARLQERLTDQENEIAGLMDAAADSMEQARAAIAALSPNEARLREAGEELRDFADRIMDAATNCCTDPDAGPEDTTSVNFTGEEGSRIANALHRLIFLSTPDQFAENGKGHVLIPAGQTLVSEDEACRFCGSRSIESQKGSDKVHPYRVVCTACGNGTAWHGDYSQSWRAWIRRPAPLAGQSREEAMEEAAREAERIGITWAEDHAHPGCSRSVGKSIAAAIRALSAPSGQPEGEG